MTSAATNTSHSTMVRPRLCANFMVDYREPARGRRATLAVMLAIAPAQRRSLRALAHPLDPVVAIGQHGLTAAVLHEIDVALLAHELIKVRVLGDERAVRETLMARICDELACAPVQHIGKLLVLWRPNPDKKAPAAKK